MKIFLALVLLSVCARAQVVLNFNVPFDQTGTSGLAQCNGIECHGVGVTPVAAIVRYNLLVTARFVCQNNDPGDSLIVFGTDPSIQSTFNCFAGIAMHFPDGVELFSQIVNFRPIGAFMPSLGTFDSGTIQIGAHNAFVVTDPDFLAHFATQDVLGITYTRFAASCVSGSGNMTSGMFSHAGGSAQFVLTLP